MQDSITNDITVAEPRVIPVAKKLALAIGESVTYRQYESALERLRQDQVAQKLLDQFQEAQQNLQMLQSWGGASDEAVKHYEELRRQVLEHPVLKTYFRAQEDLTTILQELNSYISEKLGFNFANLTKPAGGCC